MANVASRRARRTRLGFVLALLAACAGAAWWQWHAQPGLTAPPPTPAVATVGAGPAVDPPREPPPVAGPEALPAEAAAASPTTESDPPQLNNGLSWGHMAGLHQTDDGLRLRSSAAFVMEPGTGKVLLQKNGDAVLPIASLTKLMTAIVVTEAGLPLHEALTIAEEDVDNERHSRSRLRVGTTLARGEAMRLALMSSENRAAHALGRTHPGGLPAFVAAMNRKARALGMRNTTFVDPTGLSNLNQSTARDVALLASAASRQALVREYSTTPQHDVALGRRTLRFNNSNHLVKSPYWDIKLQKTGYIVEAGQCLAMNATVAGRDLILVLLDAADKRSRFEDAERIKRFAGGEPTPPARQAAASRGPRHAKAAAKAPPRMAQGRYGRDESRVRRTFAPKQAAGRRRGETS